LRPGFGSLLGSRVSAQSRLWRADFQPKKLVFKTILVKVHEILLRDKTKTKKALGFLGVAPTGLKTWKKTPTMGTGMPPRNGHQNFQKRRKTGNSPKILLPFGVVWACKLGYGAESLHAERTRRGASICSGISPDGCAGVKLWGQKYVQNDAPAELRASFFLPP